MRIAIISSSGGSAFASFYEISKIFWPQNKYFIITDRPCGIEEIASKLNIPLIRFEEKDNSLFSKKTYDWLILQKKIDFCFLFFSRLITSDLFNNIPCINFHESILPSFKGFNALRQAISNKAKFFGTTAHLVDANIDHGTIIAQTSSPLLSSLSIEKMKSVSFIQKIYLQLVIIEALTDKKISLSEDGLIWPQNTPASPQFNPSLKNKKIKPYIEKLISDNNVSSFINSDLI